jgi:hypothetical protein
MQLSESNAEIFTVLATMHAHLRDAAASGGIGRILLVEPLPYFNGHFGKLEIARSETIDLTKLGKNV